MEAMDRTNWGLLYGALVTQVMEVKRVFCFKMNKIGEDKKGKRLSRFHKFPTLPTHRSKEKWETNRDTMTKETLIPFTETLHPNRERLHVTPHPLPTMKY